MDLEDLEESIRIHRDVPPIIFANIGTTMREGVDDIPAIQGILKNLAIPQSYIHADAALCGMTLPFIDGAPEFNFSTGIHSMSISGHKLIGSPLPCGVVLALKAHVDLIARSIEYVGTLDTTITGSRNAITPLMLWHAIRSQGEEGFRAIVVECLACAEYAVEELNAIGVAAWRNPYAITVVLPKPSAVVLDKWQLAVEEDIAHIMVMPHVDRDRIDRIVADIAANPV
jgi:histidine decarboxylase